MHIISQIRQELIKFDPLARAAKCVAIAKIILTWCDSWRVDDSSHSLLPLLLSLLVVVVVVMYRIDRELFSCQLLTYSDNEEIS